MYYIKHISFGLLVISALHPVIIHISTALLSCFQRSPVNMTWEEFLGNVRMYNIMLQVNFQS